MNIKIKKLHEDAVIPSYAKKGDAGLDLTAVEIEDIPIGDTDMVRIKFGIAVEIPIGYMGLIVPRSSVYKHETLQMNSPGILDSSYRGELMQVLFGCIDDPNMYKVGDRTAQLIILPYPKITFEEVEELSSTERGLGGFGSTNLN